MNTQKLMLSGIKPSGSLTLGNYLGAIKPFVNYQDSYYLWVFIADLHALTLPIDPKELRENTTNLIATYLAAGLKPDKCTIFKQSDVPAHNQLEWLLTCNTALSDLTKMPQYKNFLDKNKNKAVPTGMLMYPSLMNADILLYDAAYVPVGADQLPHTALTRDIAELFNKKYGDIFTIPEGIPTNNGVKIMSLSDPTKKMSKSESDKGTIYLLEDVEITRKKIMKALTDMNNKVCYDPVNKPGISNLMTIYSCLSGLSYETITEKYANIENYGVFKRDIADLVCTELKALQEKIQEIKTRELDCSIYAAKPQTIKYIDYILSGGAEIANEKANEKIDYIYRKVGLR